AAVVALSDASGNQSSPVNPTLVQQPVRKLGDACDPAEVADRCAEGLSCGGKAPTCQAGAPPTLTQVAYFGGANPAELIVGSDPAEDLASIDVHFLDSSGKSLTVDLSGDGTTPPVSSVTLDATGVPGQAFFFENDPVASFTQAVPKISVTAIDVFGKTSAPVVATLATPTVRTNGLTCDPYGFTVCATGYACSPGIPGATNKCGSVQSLQTAKCNAAAAWDKQGVLAAWGKAEGTSLWDPPAGCAPAVEVNRPESVVTLVLDHAVSTLTVSTAVPETDFDTIVYVLPACASQSSEALGCSDDAQGYASTVTLTNVAAGTYTVIVDSGSAQGGHFGLSVSAQ
ncbi:MAG TPA: hypothetical protein VE987_20845, partial [Polyangiaceae bacterium]|nr:hypothetical protein [Polyangiaceae bacterium]